MFARILQVLRVASSWFLLRLACFLLLLTNVYRAPGWAKGPLWLAVFFAGLWTFLALARDAARAFDFLIPRLVHAKQWLVAWSRKHENKWRMIPLICAVGIAGMAIYRAWPAWQFMATSSLREDEIGNIATYTSRGFIPAVTTYKLARNHVFYNVLSAALPGASSTVPLRARLISFLSVTAALALLVLYAKARGWLLAGLACAGLVAGNITALEVILQARGYGFLFLSAMASCVAFAEWLRTGSRLQLKIMAISCVLGTYTLSFYVIFGGILLLLAFCHRPSKDTLLTGLLSLAAIAMLYLPIARELYGVFTGFRVKYGREMSNFDSIEGVFGTLQYFFPERLININGWHLVVLTLLLLSYVAFGRFARRPERLSAAGVGVAVSGFLAFCLLFKVVPLRAGAYLAAPFAFLATILIGSLLAARSLVPFGPFVHIGFSLVMIAVLGKCQISEPLIVGQNWRDIGLLIERAFPKETRVWVGGRYGRLLQWNLSSRKMPEGGILDKGALANGSLVAVEGFIKEDDRKSRLRWEELPENVRFVTIPVRINYQRVFFLPPTPRGISSVTVDDRPLNPSVTGRQPPDPFLLAQSFGHGDLLRSKDAGTTYPMPSSTPEVQVAQPIEILLPAVMIVELDIAQSAQTCNLLFSQSLMDKSISAEVKYDGRDWLRASDVFVLGELFSIVLERDDCRSIRIQLKQTSSLPSRISGEERPPFGLLEVWTTPRKLPHR